MDGSSSGVGIKNTDQRLEVHFVGSGLRIRSARLLGEFLYPVPEDEKTTNDQPEPDEIPDD